MQTRTGT